MDIKNILAPEVVKREKTRWNKEWKEKKVCVQIFKGLQVCADGDVVPCCVDWDRVNLLGNINKSPLKELWLGHQMKELQNEHLKGNKDKIAPCSGCTMNDYGELDNLDCLINKLEIK
jgi:radical SAM protein with 4Fe4S-binding SPASM domain